MFIDDLDVSLKAPFHFFSWFMIGGLSFKIMLTQFQQKNKLRRAYNRKRYDEAERLCHQLLEFDQNDINGLENLGRIHTNRKEHARALNYWERLSALHPVDPQWFLRTARANFNLKAYDAALEACKKVLNIDPSDPEARTLAARIHLKWGDIESAEAMRPLDTGKEGALISSIGLARLAYRLGKYSKAEAICNRIIAREADNVKALELLDRIYSRQNRYELALALWKRLGALKPNDRFLNLKIAKACYNLGDYLASDEACDRVLTSHTTDLDALELKGRLLHRQRRWPEALDIFRRLFEVKPNDLKIGAIYVKLQMRLTSENEAKRTLDTLVERADSEPDQILELALLHEELFYPEEAHKLVKKAISLSPNDPDLVLTIGERYLALQRLEIAHHFLKQAQQIGSQRTRFKTLRKRIRTILELTGTDPEDLMSSYRAHESVLTMERVVDAIVGKIELRKAMDKAVPGRVVMVSSTLNRGGAERQVVMSLQGLQQKTDAVESLTLFTGDVDSIPEPEQTFLPYLQSLDIPVRELNRPQIQQDQKKAFNDTVEPWKEYLKFLPENIRLRVENLYFQFTQLKPQIVHAWQDNTNIIAGLAAVMAGVPKIILSARSMRPDKKTRLHAINTRHTRQCYLSLLQLPHVVLNVNSKAVASSYAEWLDRDERSIPVIHNGLDFARMERSCEAFDKATFQQLGLPEEAPVVGAVFRLTEEKRPHLWVDVAARVAKALPEVHFVIVGDGAMLEDTCRYASKLGLSDRFHLPGQSNMVKAWLERMDLFLLTSRVEGLPNVLIEAQAFGVPVVTTDAGGAREVILEEQSGWVVENDDADEIAERVIWSLTNSEWIDKASRMATEQARRRFGKEQMIKRLLELYGSMEGA